MPAKKKKIVEDPNNTFNMQLVRLLFYDPYRKQSTAAAAAKGESEDNNTEDRSNDFLFNDNTVTLKEKVEQLAELGADLKEARETVPLELYFPQYLQLPASEDENKPVLPIKLSPILALIFSLLIPSSSNATEEDAAAAELNKKKEKYREEKLETLSFLLENGATINDPIPLPTLELVKQWSKQKSEELERKYPNALTGNGANNSNNANGAMGGNASNNPRARSASRHKSKFAAGMSIVGGTNNGNMSVYDPSTGTERPVTQLENSMEGTKRVVEEVNESGNVLHLLLLLKDSVYLFQFLYLFSPFVRSAVEENIAAEDENGGDKKDQKLLKKSNQIPFSIVKEIVHQLEQNNLYYAILKCVQSGEGAGGNRADNAGNNASRPASKMGRSKSSTGNSNNAGSGNSGNSGNANNNAVNYLTDEQQMNEIIASDKVNQTMISVAKAGGNESVNILSPLPPFSSISALKELLLLKSESGKDILEDLRDALLNVCATGENSDNNSVHSSLQLSFNALTSITQRSLVDLMEDTRSAAPSVGNKQDVVLLRLIDFYRPIQATSKDANVCLNGLRMTKLARACATGDIKSIEYYLDSSLNARDSLYQLSADGRYTLIHYSVGQPRSLRYLVKRGLNIESKNNFNESALDSLLLHGFGRNSNDAILHPFNNNTQSESERLRRLPLSVQRNYILSPFPSLLQDGTDGGGGGGTGTGSSSKGGRHKTIHATTAGGGDGGDEDFDPNRANLHKEENFIGGRECDGWFAFCGTASSVNVTGSNTNNSNNTNKMDALSTSELIQNLIDAGINPHGYVQDADLDLLYVKFAERQAEIQNMMMNSSNEQNNGNNPLSNSDGFSSKKNSFAARSKRESSNSGSTKAKKSSSIVNKSKSSAEEHEGPLSLAGDDVDSGNASMRPDSGASERRGSNGAAMSPSDLTADLSVGRGPIFQTPLMHCIRNYHPEMIKKFLTLYNVDIMRRDSLGATALHYAAACNPHTTPDPAPEGAAATPAPAETAPTTSKSETGKTSVVEALKKKRAASSGENTHAATGTASSSTSTRNQNNTNNTSDSNIMEIFLTPQVIQNTLLTTQTNLNSVTNNVNTSSGTNNKYIFDINAFDLNGRTPLHYACRSGNERAVLTLLQFSLSYISNNMHTGNSSDNSNSHANFIIQVGRPDSHGMTPLHDAVLSDNPVVVKYLLDYQKELNNMSNGNNADFGFGAGGLFSLSSAHSSARSRRSNSGASNVSTGSGYGGSHKRGSSVAPANQAAALLALPYVQIDTEAEDRTSHFTAVDFVLHLSRAADESLEAHKNCKNGVLLQLLLQEGNAQLHRPSQLPDGGGLLHALVHTLVMNHFNPLPSKEEKKAKENVKLTEDGYAITDRDLTPLYQLQVLLDAYADPGEVDDCDRTPLLLLLELYRSQLRLHPIPSTGKTAVLLGVQLLLQYGASVRHQSVSSLHTPLHLAADIGDRELLQLLFYEVSNEALYVPPPSAGPHQENTADVDAMETSPVGGGSSSSSILKKIKEKRRTAGSGMGDAAGNGGNRFLNITNNVNVKDEEKKVWEKINAMLLNAKENMKVTLNILGGVATNTEQNDLNSNNNNELKENGYEKLLVDTVLWSITDAKQNTLLHLLCKSNNDTCDETTNENRKQQHVMQVIIRPLLRYIQHLQYILNEMVANAMENNNKNNNNNGASPRSSNASPTYGGGEISKRIRSLRRRNSSTTANNTLVAIQNCTQFFTKTLLLMNDTDGRIPLHHAAEGGFVEVITEYLLFDFEQNNDVDNQDSSQVMYVDVHGKTVLHALVLGWSLNPVTELSDKRYEDLLHLLVARIKAHYTELYKHQTTSNTNRNESNVYGFSLPTTAILHNSSPMMVGQYSECSLTDQLKAVKRRNLPHHYNNNTIDVGQMVFEFINTTDAEGLTAYLLAAQLGAVAPSKALVRLFP